METVICDASEMQSKLHAEPCVDKSSDNKTTACAIVAAEHHI